MRHTHRWFCSKCIIYISFSMLNFLFNSLKTDIPKCFVIHFNFYTFLKYETPWIPSRILIFFLFSLHVGHLNGIKGFAPWFWCSIGGLNNLFLYQIPCFSLKTELKGGYSYPTFFILLNLNLMFGLFGFYNW